VKRTSEHVSSLNTMRDLSIAIQTLPPKQDAAITRGFFKT